MARSNTTWTKGSPPPTARKPGQSGNPSGRTRLDEAEDLTKLAVSRVRYLVDHAKDERLQFDAARELFDRLWGKAPQALAVKAHVTTEVDAGGIDRPPVIDENDAEWLERRRVELTMLEAEGRSKH